MISLLLPGAVVARVRPSGRSACDGGSLRIAAMLMLIFARACKISTMQRPPSTFGSRLEPRKLLRPAPIVQNVRVRPRSAIIIIAGERRLRGSQQRDRIARAVGERAEVKSAQVSNRGGGGGGRQQQRQRRRHDLIAV